MNLQLTKYTDEAAMRHGLFSGTQADAAALRKAFKADGFTSIETKPVEVPTSKAELIEYLNSILVNGCP